MIDSIFQNSKNKQTMKHQPLIILTLIGIATLTTYAALSNPTPQPSANLATPVISVIEAQYENDFSDNKILMGGFHNVFIGKVIAQTGTRYRLPDMHAGLETQYSVHVIGNIKGELSGEVTVAQAGGIENDRIIAMEGDVEGAQRDGASSPLLQIGSTYILTTRGDGTEGYYMLGTNPYAKKLISSDPNQSDDALSTLADQNPRTQALKFAYPEEVPMKEDVIRGTSHNEFKSLPADKKAAAQARADAARISLDTNTKTQ
jgi:hypothetical protein